MCEFLAKEDNSGMSAAKLFHSKGQAKRNKNFHYEY